MNFFDDCDTAGNTTFDHNHSGIYLYDGSPFISRIKGEDTIFNYAMYAADWLYEDGFRQLGSITIDSMGYPDYHYGRTGKFVSNDSVIALECEYFAPTASDSCSFFVSRLRVYNDIEDSILGVYIGDVMDWDIPADQGARNGTGCDPTRQLIYCYGAEYNPDIVDNDNCVLSDQRYGGLSYYCGFHVPLCTADDTIPCPRAMWTRMNADYVYPANGFVAAEMYTLLTSISGCSPWEATYTEPLDSQYQDLHMVTVYGQYDLGAGDTLVFIRILASEYDGGLGSLQSTVDRARAWIDDRPDVFGQPLGDNCVCCDEPGDADNNGVLNILDVTYIINYLYKNGPEPVCPDEADPDKNCAPNILDVTYIINYLYKNGPPPECGCVGG
jgi:hypothetical protein